MYVSVVSPFKSGKRPSTTRSPNTLEMGCSVSRDPVLVPYTGPVCADGVRARALAKFMTDCGNPTAKNFVRGFKRASTVVGNDMELVFNAKDRGVPEVTLLAHNSCHVSDIARVLHEADNVVVYWPFVTDFRPLEK